MIILWWSVGIVVGLVIWLSIGIAVYGEASSGEPPNDIADAIIILLGPANFIVLPLVVAFAPLIESGLKAWQARTERKRLLEEAENARTLTEYKFDPERDYKPYQWRD